MSNPAERSSGSATWKRDPTREHHKSDGKRHRSSKFSGRYARRSESPDSDTRSHVSYRDRSPHSSHTSAHRRSVDRAPHLSVDRAPHRSRQQKVPSHLSLLLLNGRDHLKQREFEKLNKCLKDFQEQWGRYPFQRLKKDCGYSENTEKEILFDNLHLIDSMLQTHFGKQAQEQCWSTEIPAFVASGDNKAVRDLIAFVDAYLTDPDFHLAETRQQKADRLEAALVFLLWCQKECKGINEKGQAQWLNAYQSVCREFKDLGDEFCTTDEKRACQQTGIRMQTIQKSTTIKAAYQELLEAFRESVKSKYSQASLLTNLCLSQTFSANWSNKRSFQDYSTVSNLMYHGARLLLFGFDREDSVKSSFAVRFGHVGAYAIPLSQHFDVQKRLLGDLVKSKQHIIRDNFERITKKLTYNSLTIPDSAWTDVMQAISDKRFEAALGLLQQYRSELKSKGEDSSEEGYPSNKMNIVNLTEACIYALQGKVDKGCQSIKSVWNSPFSIGFEKARILLQLGNHEEAERILNNLRITNDLSRFHVEHLSSQIKEAREAHIRMMLENQELKDEVGKLQQENQRLNEQMTMQLEGLSKELEQLKEEKADVVSKCKEADDLSEFYQHKLDDSRDELVKLEREVLCLKQNIQEKEQDYSALDKEVETKGNKIRELSERYDKLKTRFSTERENRKSTTTKLGKKNSELTKELKDLQEKTAKQASMSADPRLEGQSLERKYKELQIQFKQLSDSRDFETKELEEALSAEKRTNERLRKTHD